MLAARQRRFGFPAGLRYLNVGVLDAGWKIDGPGGKPSANARAINNGEAEQAPQRGLLTTHVRRRIRVQGRLKMPEGASADGILISGFGYGSQTYGDVPSARARADGSFELAVTAGYGYGLNVADLEWASDGWNGSILRDDAATPAPITLDVYAATPVDIRVSQGAQHASVANAWVSIRTTTGPFQWNDEQGKWRMPTGKCRVGCKPTKAGPCESASAEANMS